MAEPQLPQAFPDLSRFTQVDIGQFEQTQYNYTQVLFRPPGKKFGCLFKVESDPSTVIACSGTIPGVSQIPSASAGACEYTSFDVGGSNDGRIGRQRIDCRKTGIVGNVLQPGSKIMHGSVTCVEGEDDLTACVTKDGKGGAHGFVISQQKTWTF